MMSRIEIHALESDCVKFKNEYNGRQGINCFFHIDIIIEIVVFLKYNKI